MSESPIFRDLTDDPEPAEFATWLTPKKALTAIGNVDAVVAIALIRHRASIGRVRAAAEYILWPDGEQKRQDELAAIPASWWKLTTGLQDVSAPFWTAPVGDLVIETDSGIDAMVYHFSGVRFEPDGILALREPEAQEATTDPFAKLPLIAPSASVLLQATRHAGGAPPKPWWDDLWVEMFRQIWESELKPTAMAHIAQAMQQWADDHGHALSEATAKRAARKLWAVAKPGGS
jgi:hypothetical protein